MGPETTVQTLAAITDPGRFECLATAILREANPIYRALVHPGVNSDGKTVKAPLDGICFVQGADPPHMVAVHHTITARDDLEKKWLHDPSSVKPRAGSRPTAPAGDLIKTTELVAQERRQTPTLRATLVLTTNEEPSEALVRAVEAAGRAHGLEIDLWSRSRLSHFLDTQPTGQWLRRLFLHIEQEQLSTELFHELSKKSAEIHCPLDDPTAWIPRALDTTLTTDLRRDVTFLMARSGLGKTVACYRRLKAHLESGGFGLIVSHEIIASSMTCEQAIMTTLYQLHPSLAVTGTSALSFCSPEQPLLLVVEDVNRSGQAQRLVEKLVGWNRTSMQDDKALSNWQLLCPLWPEVFASLGDQARKRIEPLIIAAGGFSGSEGRHAVLARAQVGERALSLWSAEAISQALGHDPLLIALHDLSSTPDAHQTIRQFVEGALTRVAAAQQDHPAADYRQALRALAGEMLGKRQIDLIWHEVRGWTGLQAEHLRLLSQLAHHPGELLRFAGLSDDQRLLFRHDRVRDWLLADTAAELDRRDLLAAEVIEEPYYAEVIGTVLVWGQPKSNFLQRVASSNPLALFYALRLFGQARTPHHAAIFQAINNWLDDPAAHDQSNLHLRWEALAVLAETDFPDVPALVCKFHDRTTHGQLARLRNGDVSGGIALCLNIEPGATALWRDMQIEHAKLHHSHKLLKDLEDFLRRVDIDNASRTGALRLAGHIADPRLAFAIEACWIADNERGAHLADYLWAFGECCANDPARFLSPVCDAWAALPDQPVKASQQAPRDALAADELRWAFRRWPPLAAIDYFVQRGSQDDLRWPITYMLHDIDHPKAVLFVVQELAELQRSLEGTKAFSPFTMSVQDDWRRAQEDYGRPMSQTSRDLLLGLWQDETNDKHLRVQAFSLWAATRDADDLEVLRATKPSETLANHILRARLSRGDQQAIPTLLEKLATDEHGFWWQCGQYLWSPELTAALDQHLDRRGLKTEQIWGETRGLDRITCEMIIRLPVDEAERLLLKHWDHLHFGSHFVQAALYVATPRLLEAAQVAIAECPKPAKLLIHLASRFGINIAYHPGLTRENQVRALAPYLHLLSPMDIARLWKACNDRGWFAMRRELLDDRLQPPFPRQRWERSHAASELDKMIAEDRLHWIDHQIDGFLKADVSWAEIRMMLTAWLEQRRSLEALRVVAAAIEHRGTRDDLSVLRIYEGMTETEASQLIADTQFAVRRRSIC